MAAPKRNKQRSQAIFRLLLLAAILLAVNVIASRFHAGLDLTAEKRFTLSDATQNLLRSLKDRVVVEIYLDGKDLPPNALALREAAKERLASFQDVAGNNLLVRFVNPFEGKTDAQREEVIASLYAKGVYGTRIGDNAKLGDYSEKIIFPYAYFQMGSKKGRAVQLMEVNGLTRDIDPAKAMSVLEYKFAATIRMVQQPDMATVAWLVGNGEALGPETWDALHNILPRFFHVDTLDLKATTKISTVNDALIICKPTQEFDDKDKFKIDQYVMNGGHILWCIDPMNASLDSLSGEQQFISVPYTLGLDDLLFQYGVRLNPNLIEDRNCNPLGIITGYTNTGQPQIEAKPFTFLPIFEPTSKHPIVKNMSGVMSIFASSLDTIASEGIKKTILMESGNYSRTQPSPVRVSLSMLRFDQKAEAFNKPFQPFAVLLEGRFKSAFSTRMTASFSAVLDSLGQTFIPQASKPGKMIIVGDGDVLLNKFSAREPFPMGFSREASRLYSNQSFLINAIQYMTDSMNVLEAQGKEIAMRQLDTNRAESEITTWRWLNIGLPLAMVLIFASIYLFFRQRRYAQKIS